MTIQTRTSRALARDESRLDLGRGFSIDSGDEFAATRFALRQAGADPIVNLVLPPTDVPGEASTLQPAVAPDGDGGITDAHLVTNGDNETDGGTLELDGADSIASADVGGFTYVFVAGFFDNGISVFRLNANGSLTPVADVNDDATLKLAGALGLSTAMVDGNTYLFAAGQSDDGVSVFRVGTNGSLTNVANVTDDATMLLDGVSDTATARVGAFTYLYTAGANENGISIFRVAGDGRLTYLSNQVDGGLLELAGVRALTTVTVGATVYLIAGGFDDGISVFSINAAGMLTSTAGGTVNDTGGINLQDVSDITTAVIGGVTYVFIAGAADNGVSVYSLSAAGVLTFIDNENDSAATLIAGAVSLSISSIGSSTYLLVGGTESGLSMYRVENGSNSGYPAGSLTFLDNIADSGSRELAGSVTTHGASIGGTSYFLGAGATDDGVSTFGSVATGQLYFLASGNPADSRVAFMNNDGGNQTSFVDNNPGVDLITVFPEEIGVDSAAGFYFALVNGNPALASGARLVRGSLAGGAVTVLADYTNTADDGTDDTIVNALHVDVINHRIYVGLQDAEGDTNQTGIRQYTYNPLTGAVTDDGFIIRADTDATKPTPGGGSFDILDVRDFDFDPTMGANGTLFFTELLTGNAGANTQGLYRMDMTSHAVTLMVSTANVVGGFPSGQNNPTDFTRGYITDVEVDTSTDLVYFSVESQSAFGNPGYNATQNGIWFLAEGATNATATQLTLVGLPGGGHFYPGDMVFDQATRQLYVESEESDTGPAGGDTDDVIYVFQLNGSGTSATLINTISLIPTVISNAANIHGMYFNNIPLLASVTGTGTHIGEQAGSGIVLLTGAPTITDSDGDHLSSATVQITQSLFSSNESNTTDDRLFFGATLAASGSVAGTSITWAYNSATNTLTFSGYDTLANYQTALAGVRFQSLGDNPTNYGLNTTRTITWTVSDGAIGVPGGSQNSTTTSITIDAVNDAPVNTVPGGQTTNEDTPKAITGISISDPDANPAITNVTVTLSVLHGTLTLLTNVVGGLTAGQIANNGTATVTITAPLNDINATLANATGLTYASIADYNGSDTLTVLTNDGGNTPSGALTDSDNIAITINPVADIVNDNVSVAEDSGANNLNLLANDTFENSSRFISSVTQGTHGTVTINDNGTAGDATDDFVVYAVTDANFNGADTFQYTVTSPAGIFETATVNVTITAVNDPVTATAPTSGAVDEDVSAAITGMSIADIDTTLAPAGVYEVTLSALHGTLTLSTLTGLTFSAGDGTSDATMTFHGTLAAINTALATASYKGNLNYNGAETITLFTTDTFAGTVATGTGVATSDTKTYNFTVNAVNDAPVNTVPGTQTVAEDASLTFTGGNAISVADVDVGAGTLTVALSVAHGTLTLSGIAGLSFISGTGTGDATMTFSGTAAAINAALNGLIYAPTGNYNGSDTLQITTNDNGNTGTPGALQDTDNVTINVTAVNDPVTGTAPATLTVAEDGTNVPVTGLSISDVDAALAPAGVYEVTLSSTNGTMTLTTLTGLTFTAGDGTADATMTFHGTLAAINTALATAGYTPTGNYNGAATITLNVTDTFGGIVATGTGAATSDSDVVNVTVTAVNDPVSGTAPASLSLAEDASNVAVAGLSISDVDATLAPAGVYDVTLTATHGLLTLTTLTGLTFTAGDGTADATMTFHGTLADINTALATAKYTPDANYNGPATITLGVTDTFGGIVATGSGSATSDSDVVNVTVTAVNDTPVVAVQTSVASTEQVAGFIDPAATITDVELGALNNYAGSALTVGRNGGAQPQDLLSFGASGAFTVNGANLEAGGLVFATFTGGNGANLVITFTGSGTPATQTLVNAVVQSLQYTYTGDTPPASIVMNYSFNDGAPGNAGQGPGGSPIGTDAITINITDTPEDAPPVVDLNGAGAGVDNAAAYTEQAAPTVLAVGVTVSDVDNTTLTGAIVQVGAGFLSGFDYLTVNGGTNGSIGAISFNYVAATGTLTLTGTDTLANYQAVLAQVGFESTSDDPGATRAISWTVNDGTVNSAPATTTITVTQVNDEPTLAATGGSPTLTEGGAAVDLFSAVTASTIEAGQTFTSLTLTVTNVTDGANERLTFDGSTVNLTNGNAVTTATNGLNVTVTLAGSTATVTFSGASLSAAALQTLVDNLAYNNISENPTDANRVVTLTQVTDSGSNTPPNDNTTTLNIAATVDVNPVNDGPLNNVPGAQTINEDASFTLSTGNGNALSVADVDASTLTVTLTVAHGTLTLASTSGLSFGAGDGTADTTMTFSGTAAQINAALGSGLTYNPTANYNGPDSITVLTADNGQTGSGGPLQDNDSIAITINSVNDAPSGADKIVTGSEDDPLVFTAADFGFTDPADGNAFLAVIIDSFPAVGSGKLFLDSDGPGGAAPVDLSTVGPGVFVSVTDINAGHLYFQPDPDEYGTNYASFTFRVQDDGGMLNGGVDRDPVANTITINVTPDNLPPAVDLNGAGAGIDYATTFVEDGAAVAIGSGVAVSDPDAGIGDLIESATITLTDKVTGDALSVLGSLPGGITANIVVNAGTIVVTLSGTASQADYATAIGQIRYATTNQDPTVGGTDLARTITVTVNDGTIDSAVATTTVSITPVDDAPVAQPDAFTITESQVVTGASLFANNGSGADSDPDGPALAISAVNGSAGNVGNQILLASGALLRVNANGTFDYDPNGAFLTTPTPGSGASNTPAHDSFTYTVAGGNTVTVSITLTGLDTDDILLGTAGSDMMFAGAGNDTLTGGAGDDQLDGGTGTDTALFTAANLIFTSTAIGWVVGSSEGNDVLQRTEIVIDGTGQRNLLVGATAFAGIQAAFDAANAGDFVRLANGSYSGTSTYADANLTVIAQSGAVLNTTFTTAGTDGIRVYAADGADTITTGAGNDALFGGAGVDHLNGDGGNDYLDGGTGADVMAGGTGDDIYIVDNAGDVVTEGAGGGNDIVYASTSYALLAGAEVELLSVNDHSALAAINLTGNELGNVIYGNAGANLLDGGAGADNMVGFGGNDIFLVDNLGDVVVEGAGGGNDIVYASASYALLPDADVELLSVNDHSALTAINLSGSSIGNTIYGNAGANVLDGRGGSDALVGFGGADTFMFTTALGAGNVDLIADFAHNVDKIALDDAIFTTLGLGSLSASAFVTGTGALDADDRIIYEANTGALYYDADGNGAGAQILFAVLYNAPTLTASDFTVI